MRYWKRQGKPAEPGYTPEGLRILHVGILLHNWIQDVISNAGIAVAIEQELEDEHRIGHLDALVDIDGQRILYDFKTVNGKKWFYLEKNNFRPELWHICQIITYAEMLADFPDQMHIVYLNRDTLNMAECNVALGVWQDKVKRDWDILLTSWERQYPPAQTTELWECNYCGYKDTCSWKA